MIRFYDSKTGNEMLDFLAGCGSTIEQLPHLFRADCPSTAGLRRML
jgi:hypothetical protein